ncbi:hypothetical protein W97_07954 [Coniosporium apollinis CBS 100218]|uniref:Amine oxidase domain-containing protein n=1 Tax=Coniosporium apollinis (strain CBS 100218) TaxID=1168221 RepID=R7Z457_CONA1|nr:uncharacterized protein W97_07954 [Coniosporium apollinis CBS 100218]EON68696.1 hypothetical protein W97_07954 [Coniosporium apollinis CBS 100218]
MGKSVVVTYFDPATNGTTEIGVVVWHDLPVVRDYFARFDIPLVKASFATPGVSTIHADLRSGDIVDDYKPASPNAALAAYAVQLAKYPFLEVGFDVPYPVPPDLLLPFGEFVEKYAIDAAMHTVFGYAQGIGDLLPIPTIYVMKLFGLDVLRNLRVGFLTTERHNNGELYEKAHLELGDDALPSSEVVKTDRDAKGYATVFVKSPSGPKLIKASTLLVTIPPKPKNLRSLDLDSTERSLFSQFTHAGYYSALLCKTGIPDTARIRNIGAHTAYNLPILPGVYYFAPTGIPGLHAVKYGSPVEMSDEQVKADMIATLERLKTAGTVPSATPERAEFVVFRSYAPFELRVPAGAIEAGFYKELYKLQGRRRTFYTGAAFHAHDSSLLWLFTEALLARIVA